MVAFTQRSPRLSAGRADALRRRRADELLAVHLRVRAGEHRASPARGTLDGQADDAALVAVADGGDQAGRVARPAVRHGQARRAGRRARVRRRHCMRPNFVQPYRCRNVLIEGVTIVNSPMWELNPVLCTNVTVRGVTIRSHGPNNDGCDPESCARRADRELHVRHRRRLHRAQVRPQQRRPAPARANRERRHPRLRHAGRPWRRRDWQRDLRRRAQHLRRALPHGQPAARSRAALQEQRRARRRDRARRDARRDGRRGGRGDRRRRLLLRGRRHGRVHAGAARRRRPQRHQPKSQYAFSAASGTSARRCRTSASSTARSTASRPPTCCRACAI